MLGTAVAGTEPGCNEAARLARLKEIRDMAVRREDQELAFGSLVPPDADQSALERMGQARAGQGNGAGTLDGRVGPFYDTAALLETLQVSSDTLDVLVRTGDVLGVISSDGCPLFPAFQFGQDAQPLPRLRDVLAQLDPGQVDPWGDAVWLNAPAEELEGVSPATALRLGRTEDVVRLARAAGSFRFG
ncbi:hypothetical protein [Curtobacterium poinsettiae]|uniref:hypothetical protein n=1 Tax=Curtobacterium poinsettiae TaxID=159612 RepID=UPI00235F0010|nr:hypothetical protein [Curtobacterium flaccumfaciens]